MAPETPDQSAPSPAALASSSDSDSGCALEDYLDLKPQSCSVKNVLPSNEAKALQLVRTLLQLLPPQDCDEKFCSTLGEHERRELHKFSAHRRVHSMGHGVMVHTTVGASHTCRRDSRIYCGRHHAELTRARCATCDQLIMSERCTIAEGLCWHVEHFCCWECEVVLAGGRYVMKGGRPFCSGCFQRLHAESCEACGEPIDPDGELVALKGQYWHTLPSCFCCSHCRTPLQMAEFMMDDDHLYCSQHCLSSGSRTPCLSKHHSNMMRASATKCDPLIYCTTWSNTKTGTNHKQLKPPLHDTYSRCQEGLCIGTEIPEYSQIMEGEEDTSCSSSDSEPEGFFLGRPIPDYSPSKSTSSPIHGKSSDMKRCHRRKSCKVS
ncbi:prickle-like protein 4 isoform X2 [Dendropsophus ebraccatus]|uniref:prickle-like protein 4 isoform X2 n=1 Tax=Dendropsophus ebraccatus TaxID=150705 RepID=UPI0038321139